MECVAHYSDQRALIAFLHPCTSFTVEHRMENVAVVVEDVMRRTVIEQLSGMRHVLSFYGVFRVSDEFSGCSR